ncbi:heavy metal-associated isoprenylated plant protein 7-like [Phragmites australis]|uniref:heavy metal-associated isoprenylated plant protein 7-like n=1 Tax=Phragmites australis TaxID=29695 RepID=UPI002D785501|nr:heavy metal-associated isoprenylated plant protein 7-like [Phragmites australis]
MGEEEKVKESPADSGKEAEEKKGEGGGREEKGEDKKEEAPLPPPPEEVVMRVFMHCEGCSRKVKKILKGFDGVEDVSADSKAHKVVVKGKKAAADPMKVVERVQKKTGRKVELLSPLPLPKEKKEDEKKEEPEPPKPEEKKEEPMVVAVVLKVHMHCEACAQVIKKKILKMNGVQSAEPDLKASQVTVKGVFEEAKLADYVHRRTGKHAAIVKSEPVAAENAGDGNAKDDKKATEGDEEKKDDNKEEKKDGGDTGVDEKEADKQKDDSNAGGGEEKDPAAMANLYMHYPRFNHPSGYGAPGYAYQYAPQLFSDENPNACSVM